MSLFYILRRYSVLGIILKNDNKNNKECIRNVTAHIIIILIINVTYPPASDTGNLSLFSLIIKDKAFFLNFSLTILRNTVNFFSWSFITVITRSRRDLNLTILTTSVLFSLKPGKDAAISRRRSASSGFISRRTY